jgi:hypothetical protein
MGPSYVYVRYRCGRCKRLGEQLVDQETWDPSVLQPVAARIEKPDLDRFTEMGEITAEEVIAFHYAVAQLTADPEGDAAEK